jgi:predicted P-loop ATPase
MIISKINNLASAPADIEIQDYITWVRTGVTQDLILKIRNEQDKEQKTKLKKGLPAVIFGGIFKNNRQKSGLVEKSGLIGLDIDGLDVSEFKQVRQMLQKDPYSMVVNVSAGGKGFCVVMKYKVTNDFTETFAAIEKYYLEEYGIVLDSACKDINRLRFISYDPEIYHNEKARTWVKTFKEEETKKHEKIIMVQSDFDEIIKQIQTQGIDLSDDDYAKYRAIGFALSDQFGEGGRDYFHIVCQNGAKYKQRDCDKHYTNFCKATGHGITIATFYHFCKEKGIQTYSEETKTIIKRASTLKRSGITSEGVINNLKEFDNVDQKKSEDIVKQVFNSNFNFLKAIQKEEDKNDFAIITEYIQDNFDFKVNEITRKLELKGKPVTDRTLNTCLVKTSIALGDINVPQQAFFNIIYSDVVPMYNPIIEFIGKNTETDLGDTDFIKELSNSIIARNQEESERNYLFIKKWYVGMIATSLKNGVSPLSLVLCGGQGTGKTEWFRRLLPNELKSLYAESKLDAGKDDEILMTQKVLIVDDEFGGKSKQEEKRFKEITSKQIFNLREPYGRVNVDLDRLATLGGTTNDTGILNDPTGNRRLIPIFVQSIDHEQYNAIDKDLLFIQAYREYEKGFNYNLTREEVKLLNDSTGEFEQVDSLEELFLSTFTGDSEYGVAEYLTNTEIWTRIQPQGGGRIGSGRRLGQILKKLGFKQISKRMNGSPRKVYKVYYINAISQNTDEYNERKAPF